MNKRGRKRKGYFYEEQEQAVIDFQNAPNQRERDKIFNEWLRPAFTQMIESIIRRYKLYVPDEEFEDTFNDTISFLMTKIEKFDASKGFKAYSYCGTVCKHYLLLKLTQYEKTRKKLETYSDIYETFTDDSRYTTNIETDECEDDFVKSLISNTCTEIQNILNKSEDMGLTEDEIKVGKAMLHLFDNWEEVFVEEMGSNKFNKSSILLYLKEMTNLSTPGVRKNMKKYKSVYYNIKEMMLES